MDTALHPTYKLWFGTEETQALPTSNQLSIVWNKLDVELQRDIPKPTKHTTVASFIEQLEEKMNMWQRLFNRPPSPRGPRYGNNPPSCNGPNRGYNPLHQVDPQNRGYSGNPPQQQTHDVDAQSAAYFADQETGEGYEHDSGYANRAIPKRAYPCNECNAIYLLNSQLNYHIHEPHYDYLISAYNVTVAPIGYATVKAGLGKLTAKPRAVCLDSGATHTLVDRSLVADNMPQSARKTLQIHRIASNFTSSEYIDLRLHIHSNDSKSKAFVVCKAYIVDEIDAGILIGMDVMQTEGMNHEAFCCRLPLRIDSHSVRDSTASIHGYYTLRKATNLCYVHGYSAFNTIPYEPANLRYSYNSSPRACRKCNQSFLSSNSLHEHPRTSGHATLVTVLAVLAISAVLAVRILLPSLTLNRVDKPWRKQVDGGPTMEKAT
ncbi:MAG: hypothetical protein M1830_009085 [Pleopsidium flavum]|nr:MAG: hypothetical protein M1830_009085 [Pleopsidium flavum]